MLHLIYKYVCVYKFVGVCAPELLSLTLRIYCIWNTLCRYRPNRVVSFDSNKKHSSAACTDQVSAAAVDEHKMSTKCSSCDKLDLGKRRVHTQEPAYEFASVIAKSS